MGENELLSEDVKKSLALAQLDKLNLEIKNLRGKSRWEDRIAKYIPLITTFIAVAGLVLTVWQSQGAQNRASVEQERERINRIQHQIRVDKEQLLEFTTNEKITMSRLIFLLDDLSSLIGQLPESKKDRLNVTTLLISLVGDCSFSDVRQIGFDVQAIHRWEPYSEYWKENPEAHNTLFNRYRQAFLLLHAEDPPFFESIEYKGTFYKVTREPEAPRMLRFTRLVEGYKMHLAILEQLQDRADVERQIEGFKLALNNATLTKQLFERKIAKGADK